MSREAYWSTPENTSRVWSALPGRTAEISARTGLPDHVVKRAIRVLRKLGAVRPGEPSSGRQGLKPPWVRTGAAMPDLPGGESGERISEAERRRLPYLADGMAERLRAIEIQRGTCRILVANGQPVSEARRTA